MRIVLDYKEIFVPGHWGNKSRKIQYETHIPYTEILNIYLMFSGKNSKGQYVEGVGNMPYIVFELKSGKKKSINVRYYTKKQTVNIIDEVITRAKELGNDLQLKNGSEMLIDLLEFNKKKIRSVKKKKYKVNKEEKQLLLDFKKSIIPDTFKDEFIEYMSFVEEVNFTACDMLLKGNKITKKIYDWLVTDVNNGHFHCYEDFLKVIEQFEVDDYTRVYCIKITQVMETFKKYYKNRF